MSTQIGHPHNGKERFVYVFGKQQAAGTGHLSNRCRIDWVWFPHLQRGNPACVRNPRCSSDQDQTPCPAFFHWGQKMYVLCFPTPKRELACPKSKQPTYESWRVGLSFSLFFFKAWMSCHADSWEAGQSGSWVLYYTSKIQPALPNFISLAPSCLLGHLYT